MSNPDSRRTLISKRGCPFAQRTMIVLHAKALPYELTEIDTDNKPDWFEALSPLSKVPVLIDDEHPLVESVAVNEYLEERYPEPPLMPSDPADRARMRFWVLFDETRLTPAFYRLLLTRDPATEQRLRRVYERELSFLTTRALLAAKPFILGADLSLADITLITHLQRLPILIEHRGVSLPQDHAPLERWIDAVNAHPAIKAGTPAWSVMTDDMAPYVGRTAASITARDMMDGIAT